MSASDQLKWQYSLQAGLQFGDKQPPAVPMRPKSANLSVILEPSVHFDNSFFMLPQGSERAKRKLLSYFKFLLARVAIPPPAAAVDDESGGDNNNNVSSSSLRFIGIVTQLHDPYAMHGEVRNAPWEFYAVPDGDDDEAILTAIDALNAQRPSLQHQQQPTGDNKLLGAAASVADDEYVKNRLSLFCGKVPRFSMMYPGAVIGVVGTPLRRDLDGHLTSVLVNELYGVEKPSFPWCVASPERPLVSSPATPFRVHFASGPFPRRALFPIVESLVQHAAQRQSNLLIIGGPMFPPFEEHEKSFIPLLKHSFEDQMQQLVESIETAHLSLRATNPTVDRLKIVLVPSVDDVVQIPVMPQPQFNVRVEDDAAVLLSSNPCRITVPVSADGATSLTFGVSTFDSVTMTQDVMVERMPGSEDGNLIRSVQALMQSRLYVPMHCFPNPLVDSAHLAGVALHGAVFEHGAPDAGSTMTTLEDFPHVCFLPSVKPSFAFTTFGKGQDMSDAVGRGNLVINPMVWTPKRRGQMYFLNVSEVTILDAYAAATHGPGSAAAGVSVVSFAAYRE